MLSLLSDEEQVLMYERPNRRARLITAKYSTLSFFANIKNNSRKYD